MENKLRNVNDNDATELNIVTSDILTLYNVTFILFLFKTTNKNSLGAEKNSPVGLRQEKLLMHSEYVITEKRHKQKKFYAFLILNFVKPGSTHQAERQVK